MNKQTRKTIGNILFGILLVVLLFYLLFPFYWAFVSSLKTPGQLYTVPPQYWPTNPTLGNYQEVLQDDIFLKSLWNSIFISFTVTAISLAFGSFAAYALGRLPFRGKSPITYLILSLTMFPLIAVVGSLFTWVRDPCVVFPGGSCSELSLYNTRMALIITYLVFTLPFTTYVLTNFFRTLPGDLESAALVDGATPFQTFYMVLLPLTMPAVVTTGMLAFISAWNEYLFALSFTLDVDGGRTVQPVIASFAGASSQEIPWGNIMAAAVVVTIPLIVLVLIFQRRIVDGLTAGAVKG
jgi:trehalose/maltose transport system permease protein